RTPASSTPWTSRASASRLHPDQHGGDEERAADRGQRPDGGAEERGAERDRDHRLEDDDEVHEEQADVARGQGQEPVPGDGGDEDQRGEPERGARPPAAQRNTRQPNERRDRGGAGGEGDPHEGRERHAGAGALGDHVERGDRDAAEDAEKVADERPAAEREVAAGDEEEPGDREGEGSRQRAPAPRAEPHLDEAGDDRLRDEEE